MRAWTFWGFKTGGCRGPKVLGPPCLSASASGFSWEFVFTAPWAGGLPGLVWQRPSPPFPLFQDALLNLGSVLDVAGLQRAVKEALSAVLPRVVGTLPHICPKPLSSSLLYLQG